MLGKAIGKANRLIHLIVCWWLAAGHKNAVRYHDDYVDPRATSRVPLNIQIHITNCNRCQRSLPTRRALYKLVNEKCVSEAFI